MYTVCITIHSFNRSFVCPHRYPVAVILVPNKDLANQVVSMSQDIVHSLVHKEGIQVTVGSLLRNVGNERWPFKPGTCPTILVCTPTILANFVRGPVVLDEALFSHIRHLVLDEADMLVEGSYLMETERILEALKKSRRQKIRDGLISVFNLLHIYTSPSLVMFRSFSFLSLHRAFSLSYYNNSM